MILKHDTIISKKHNLVPLDSETFEFLISFSPFILFLHGRLQTSRIQCESSKFSRFSHKISRFP